MNYKLIYDQIIEKAKHRNLNEYKEKHHIIPKCIGGIDNDDNIVELTAKEHFLCHKLLVNIYPTNKKLKWALYNMCRFKKYSSSRDYELGRIKLAQLKNKKIIQYDMGGNFIREWESSKQACETYNFNPINISSCLNNRGKSAHGFIWVFKDENKNIDLKKYRRKQHSPRSANKSGKYGQTKPVIQYDTNHIEINHFSSIVEASKSTNVRADSISSCCRGLQKTSGGFIWKYKK